jgi:hypothetical protein
VHSCSPGVSVVGGGRGTFRALQLHGNLTAQIELADCRRQQPPVFEECAVGPGPAVGVMIVPAPRPRQHAACRACTG